MSSFLDFLHLLGMTMEEAERSIGGTGYSLRVRNQDGNPCVCIMDYNPQRINVRVDDGKITRIERLG